MKQTSSIAFVGECLLELNHAGGLPSASLNYGGDAYNTAFYARKLISKDVKVFWVSSVGTDNYSEWLRKKWRSDGLCLDQVITNSNPPGLYGIQIDESGERHFCYWRKGSSASRMFDGQSEQEIVSRLIAHDWVFIIGITLAVLPSRDRKNLVSALGVLSRIGKKIAFDPNWRAPLWPSASHAKNTFAEILPMCDLVLTNFEDDSQVWDDVSTNETLSRTLALGAQSCVVKNGAREILLGHDGRRYRHQPKSIKPVDTTAAGDAFNAGFLTSHIQAKPINQCIQAGCDVASQVIAHHGAIIELH